jgi:hypothetical protein
MDAVDDGVVIAAFGAIGVGVGVGEVDLFFINTSVLLL